MSIFNALRQISNLSPYRIRGLIRSVLGLMVEVVGLDRWAVVGSQCHLISRTGRRVPAEVVGFQGDIALVMPYYLVGGLGPGCYVEFNQPLSHLMPSEAWLGRVLNGLGHPVDNKGVLPLGSRSYELRQSPPPAHTRHRVGAPLDLGVRVLNLFTTCCEGQRMGVFAGSGVGKSMLLSMMARYAHADIIVIGLVGERGREVQEFIQDCLGEDGLQRSVVIVATSDEAPLMRRQAAYTTLTVAEYFADQGKSVLCLMDSVTRFAMALREIGLAMGEPPATKGYTPSVFAELPKLLERAGPKTAKRGPITGLFTVLVEGDDHNEPIADTVRGILDGHIVLERAIAERGRFPAVNVLRSVSRTMPDCNPQTHTETLGHANRLLSLYEDMADMIRLGAYKKGSDPEIDEAIEKVPPVYAFLNQTREDRGEMKEDLRKLRHLLGYKDDENLG